MEVIEKYIEYLKKEVDRCEEYIDNIALQKYKYELRENPDIKKVTFQARDTSDPDYTANVLRQRIESLDILRYFENIDDRTFFPEYKLLENSLKNSNLKLNEQIEVIKYFISKNAEIFINCEKRYIFDMNKIENMKFKYFTHEEIYDLIDNNGVSALLNKIFLFGKQKRKQKELRKILPDILSEPVDEELYISIYREFIKKEKITENSIVLFINGLKKLGMSSDYCEKVKKHLSRQIKGTKKEEIEYNFNFNNESKNEAVSAEERKMLNDSYDFDKQELKGYIPYSKSLDYVKIMKKMGVSNNDIIIFLKRIYEELNKQNPVTKYLELRDKILYYKDKYFLDQTISNLDEYLTELLNIDDIDFNEAYDYWEDAINDELEIALSYIPRDYKYELAQRD